MNFNIQMYRFLVVGMLWHLPCSMDVDQSRTNRRRPKVINDAIKDVEIFTSLHLELTRLTHVGMLC